MKKKLLIIEDEEDIQEILKFTFLNNGFDVRSAYDGKEGVEIFNTYHPDIIILDIMLPKLDGFEVCKILSQYDVPIIMLTARNDLVDKLLGLNLGADDYITKPFDIRECVARVNAIFRRNLKNRNKYEGSKKILEYGDIKVNTDERKVFLCDEEIKLKPKERELLLYLIENKNMALSRNTILNEVWGYDYYGDERTVDVHVRKLREKLKDNRLIETSFGIGYLFRGDLFENKE